MKMMKNSESKINLVFYNMYMKSTAWGFGVLGLSRFWPGSGTRRLCHSRFRSNRDEFYCQQFIL